MSKTIEETVAQLIEANLRESKIVQVSGRLRKNGLSDYYIRTVGKDGEPEHPTIFKYRTNKFAYLVRIVNLYEAIDIIKEHWDERFTEEDYAGVKNVD